MIDLPATSLVLFDTTGQTFGKLRLVPVEGKSFAECVFDVAPTNDAQAARPEVRWLCKRHYRRYSEHRLSIADDGTLTVKKASFRLELHPAEDGDGYQSHPPAPPVRAAWSSVG